MKSAKVALVTGGAGAIGGAVTEKLLAAGHEIALVDISQSALELFVAQHTKQEQKRLYSYQLDVSDPAQTAAAVADIEARTSGIDYVVNSAGVTVEKSFMEHTMEDWERVLRINLIGSFNVCHAVAAGMMKRKRGRIVNLASRLGVCGTPDSVAYSASKAGVIGFTKALAYELAEYNITVNALAPGVVISAMTEELRNKHSEAKLSQLLVKRFARPDEAAEAIWFLLHHDYFTGQTIHMNGGSYMSG